jgi:hypothetical protein
MVFLDDSLVVRHFIPPHHLLTLLERRAFCLCRQDEQSDNQDGVLPQSCFEQPYFGDLEHALGVTKSFAVSQAHAIAKLRERTVIMSWTYDMTEYMQSAYGEGRTRCELRATIGSLKRMLCYEFRRGCEFPPKERDISEVPKARTAPQLISPQYTNGVAAPPVIPSALATAIKRACYKDEKEVRVQAIINPDDVKLSRDQKVFWAVETFEGLSIAIGPNTPFNYHDQIRKLAATLKIPVS